MAAGMRGMRGMRFDAANTPTARANFADVEKIIRESDQSRSDQCSQGQQRLRTC